MRRGELVIQFATPTDLTVRVAELSSVLSQLDQESGRPGDTRARSRQVPRTPDNGGTRRSLEPESGDGSAESRGQSV